jgi:hypothetical protein
VDTLTRRELLRRVVRAAVLGPVILRTGDQQTDLLFRLSRLFGDGSLIGRWLKELWLRW